LESNEECKMKYDRIVIRYGEMSTKKRNRNKFVDKLKGNVQSVLSDIPNLSIQARRERMYIVLNGADGDEVVSRLTHVFGIQSMSPAVKTSWDIEEIKDVALKLVQKLHVPGGTFKISSKRADKTFPLETNELNHTLGAHILRNTPTISVDVKNPDIDLKVEVRKEGVYLSSEDILGAGGLPVGSSGKAMLMLSGGIDSPVAGYLSLKRGVEIEAVHFHSPPFTSERAKEKVLDLAKKLTKYGRKIKVHLVPFTEIQQKIHEQVPENYTMTSTRRLMLRITDILREKHEGLAIITGESLGQVASQTLESMFAINDVTNTPILRPLVSMDKTEIIQIAKEIDTLDISNRPYEDCCTIFTPPSPKTKPKKEKVRYYESFIDFEPLIVRAVEGTETIIVDSKKTQEKNLFDDLL
jgi:tRNA uracil 4-sulfurtransferase